MTEQDGSLAAANHRQPSEPSQGEVTFDPVATLDARYLPDDAGEFADGLGRILARIPSGWGRWISCGAGWYPLLVRLEEQIASVAPDYEIYQVKEKFGTLRFYWGFPPVEPVCCLELASSDPRPGDIGGSLDPELQSAHSEALLGAWLERRNAHLQSAAHAAGAAEQAVPVLDPAHDLVVSHINSLVAEAEGESARTCERCSAPGFLQRRHGWFSSLCGPCGEARGFTAAS